MWRAVCSGLVPKPDEVVIERSVEIDQVDEARKRVVGGILVYCWKADRGVQSQWSMFLQCICSRVLLVGIHRFSPGKKSDRLARGWAETLPLCHEKQPEQASLP